MSISRITRALVRGSLAVLISAGVAFAQSKDAKGGMPQLDEQTKAMMAEMERVASPGPEHKVLGSLVGKWKTVAKNWFGPGDPILTEGTAEGEMVMGGRFLKLMTYGSMMGKPFTGMEFIGYDRMANAYAAFWLDDMSTSFYSMTDGTYDEASKTLTLKAAWVMPGAPEKVPYKLVTKTVNPDTHTFTMIASRGGKEITEMEVTYTRVR